MLVDADNTTATDLQGLRWRHNLLPTYTERMTDWDASRYHRLSNPQVGWGRQVLARLEPVAGRRVLDIGCGTGRLTAEIASHSRRFVVGVDRSASMLTEASRTQEPAVRVALLRAADESC